MTYFLNKIHLAIALLLITVAGYAYGDRQDFSPCAEGENCLPCQPTCCWGNGFIGADLLYWRVYESGLDTCIPSQVCDTVQPDGKVISRFTGKSHDLDFKWEPGFRIRAGYELPDSPWVIETSWAHLHSHACRRETRWNINFDVIDLIAGYGCELNCQCILRPFFGLRGTKIHQRLHIGEFASSISSSIADDQIIAGKKSKEKLTGLGPLIGLEADWNIGCGFSFYASASISRLYGHFNIRLTEFDEFIDTVNFCKIRKRLHANLAVNDAELGIRWQRCLCGDTQLFLGLGLEHHCYFDYNRFCNYGDLSFDGLTFSAGVEF